MSLSSCLGSCQHTIASYWPKIKLRAFIVLFFFQLKRNQKQLTFQSLTTFWRMFYSVPEKRIFNLRLGERVCFSSFETLWKYELTSIKSFLFFIDIDSTFESITRLSEANTQGLLFKCLNISTSNSCSFTFYTHWASILDNLFPFSSGISD